MATAAETTVEVPWTADRVRRETPEAAAEVRVFGGTTIRVTVTLFGGPGGLIEVATTDGGWVRTLGWLPASEVVRALNAGEPLRLPG